MLDTDITPPIYPRGIQPRVLDALADTPVVLLSGPRQAGKTTLVRQLAGSTRRYLTLDDEVTCLAAKEDPVGLIRSIDSAVIDEIQRAPDLFLAIKKTVDEDRRLGRFLLTGSANLMTLPSVADSLGAIRDCSHTGHVNVLAGCFVRRRNTDSHCAKGR